MRDICVEVRSENTDAPRADADRAQFATVDPVADGLRVEIPAAEVELSDEILERIDAIVTPGTTINPADDGRTVTTLSAEMRWRRVT